MRAISRVMDVSFNTVMKLLIDAGIACAVYHDRQVRNVWAKRVQCDEVWSFCAAKQKNVASMKSPIDGAGDIWTWTAMDGLLEDDPVLDRRKPGRRERPCAYG